MGKVYDHIDESLRAWLLAQPVFFVGTAPLSGQGSVNVSPKGMDGTFAVLGPKRVGYLDYFGSGIETHAHLQENGRIVVMMCAFDGPPKVVRLHGRGRTVLPDEPEFADLRPHFGKDRTIGQRSIVIVDLERISDSCGYSVPRMDFLADRDILDLHHIRRDEQYFTEYGATRNARSVDDLPGLTP